MHRLTKALLGSTCLTLLSAASAEALPILEPVIGFGPTFTKKTILPASTLQVVGRVGELIPGSSGSSSSSGTSSETYGKGEDFLTFTKLKPASPFTLHFLFDPPGGGSSDPGSSSGSSSSSSSSSAGSSSGGATVTASETFVSFFDDLGMPIDLDGDPTNGIDNTKVGKSFDIAGFVPPSGRLNLRIGTGPDDTVPATYQITLDAQSIPEPAALGAIAVGAVGAAGLGFLRRRRQKT